MATNIEYDPIFKHIDSGGKTLVIFVLSPENYVRGLDKIIP